MHSQNVSFILKQDLLNGPNCVCQVYLCRNQITQMDILIYSYVYANQMHVVYYISVPRLQWKI